MNITNNTQETVIFDPKEMIGILDLRSLGYNKIRQGILQQSLSKYYHFEPADALCEKFNKFLNTLKKEMKESKEKYPWLDKNNERKYMTDREILYKCQLFKTELQSMGNTTFIKEKRVCVRPLHSRLEATQKIKPPMTMEGCRSSMGMVNFVSIFCLELQILLKPIYDLTRKGRHFIWRQEQ